MKILNGTKVPDYSDYDGISSYEISDLLVEVPLEEIEQDLLELLKKDAKQHVANMKKYDIKESVPFDGPYSFMTIRNGRWKISFDNKNLDNFKVEKYLHKKPQYKEKYIPKKYLYEE